MSPAKRSRSSAREIAGEPGLQLRLVRHRAVEQVVLQGDLGVAQQHGKLRPGEAAPGARPLLQLHVARQRLERAVEQLARLQRAHQQRVVGELARAACRSARLERQRLLVVVAQRGGGHVLGHVGQQLVARGGGELARRGVAGASAILMLTSWSEVLTPAELSMKSVLMRPPRAANSMRARCVTPRLAPSPITLARTSAAGDAQGIVGAVADIGIASRSEARR